jgi:putative salt-induced outer membrane protein YdiY
MFYGYDYCLDATTATAVLKMLKALSLHLLYNNKFMQKLHICKVANNRCSSLGNGTSANIDMTVPLANELAFVFISDTWNHRVADAR